MQTLDARILNERVVLFNRITIQPSYFEDHVVLVFDRLIDDFPFILADLQSDIQEIFYCYFCGFKDIHLCQVSLECILIWMLFLAANRASS